MGLALAAEDRLQPDNCGGLGLVVTLGLKPRVTLAALHDQEQALAQAVQRTLPHAVQQVMKMAQQ